MSEIQIQRNRILTQLLTAPGLCAMQPLRWEPPITRVAARIYDLRQQGETIITQTTCPNHQSGKAPHAYYQLTGLPTNQPN